METLPELDVCGHFTHKEAVKYLSDVITKLKQSEIISDCISRISQSFFDYDDETLDQIVEEFIRSDMIELFCHCLRLLSKAPLDVNNETLNLLLTSLVNFSDHSSKFAKAINSSPLVHLVVDNCLDHVCISNEFVKKCVLVVHNIARDPNNRISHRISEFKKALVKFIQFNDNDKLGVASLLTLSYLVGEDDVELLNKGSKIISNLIGKIKLTVEKDGPIVDYATHELIHGLMCISANDNMKQEIYDAGGVSILVEVIQRNREKEIEPSLGTIENLCFNDKIREKLVSELAIEAVLKPLEQHASAAVRKHCDGILWKIHNKAESLHNRSKSNAARSNSKSASELPFDVFISYAWANKSKILEILEYLKRHDIRAWIDKEQMRGSSLEAMATGIENSKLFIVAVSPSYKSSASCRHEAEYAFTIKKPMIPVVVELRYKADSWLGLIVGCKVYYELSERRDVGEVIGELVRDIEHALRADGGSNGPMISGDRGKCAGDRGKGNRGDICAGDKGRGHSWSAIRNLGPVIENWTNADVIRWLDNANLGHLELYFRNVDGSMLSIMLEIRANSPEYFNRTLEKQFAMDFIDLMRFHKLLNDLV